MLLRFGLTCWIVFDSQPEAVDVPGKLGVSVLFGSHIVSEKAFCPLEQL